MDILMNLGLLAGSLLVLIKGSDWFVDSAEKIGLRAGISPFVIGVTVVAFGTSLPELATAIQAVLNHHPEIASNVVVGSNITNILLVLGAVSMVQKAVKMDYDIMDIDMPLLVASAILLWFVFADGVIAVMEAIILLFALVVFLVNSLSHTENRTVDPTKLKWHVIPLLILGAVCVKFGSEYTEKGIIGLSKVLNLDGGIISATLLALGTSLPEVVVSLTAAFKGKPGIAVGNVLGSNIFNSYAVIAIPSFFGTLTIDPSIMEFNMPFMIAVTILFTLITIGGRITRWEGLTLLLFYVYYLYRHLLPH